MAKKLDPRLLDILTKYGERPGDCSGICASCRDEREEQARIDAMSDEAYAQHRACRDNAAGRMSEDWWRR